MEMSRSQFFIYAFIGQVIFGILLGLIPFFLGRRRGEPRLGLYGLIASIVAGALSPLAALVVVGVFSWLIVRKKDNAVPTETDKSTDLS